MHVWWHVWCLQVNLLASGLECFAFRLQNEDSEVQGF